MKHLWKKNQNLGPTSLIKVRKYKGFVKISSTAATKQDVKSIREVRCRRKKSMNGIFQFYQNAIGAPQTCYFIFSK